MELGFNFARDKLFSPELTDREAQKPLFKCISKHVSTKLKLLTRGEMRQDWDIFEGECSCG